MKKKTIIVIVFILSLLAFVNVYAEEAQAGTILEANATKGEVFRTEMVDITLKASNIEDIYTMQMEISYNPEMLELDQANLRNLAWNNNQNGYSAIQIDSTVGKIKIIYSKKGKVSGVSGDINLIGLKFESLRIGQTSIEFTNIKLINSQGRLIDSTASSVIKEIEIMPNPLNVNISGEKGHNDWFVSPVMVTIDDLDAKEICYTVDGTQYSYTQPFVLDVIGQHQLKVTSNDGYGFIKDKEEDIQIDYEKPFINVDNKDYDWQNEVIKVIPEFDDANGSGILQSWYQWTNTSAAPIEWEEYKEGALGQSEEGIWYLHAKSVDIAGNTQQTVFGPYKIDKIVPLISVDYENRETWENTDIIVTPTFTDEGGSQIKYMGYQWSLDSTLELSNYTAYLSGSILHPIDGTWYLHLVVEDWAGNTSTDIYGPYKIDKSAPVIEIQGITEGMDYTDMVAPIISIYDAVTEIKNQSILLDGQDYMSGTPITERGTHIFTVSAEDICGNISMKSMMFKVYSSTSITLGAPQVEYSDGYAIKVSLNADNQAVSGAAIMIRLNGRDLGTSYTDEQGNAVLNDITYYSAGNYIIDAIYLQDDSEYFRAVQAQSSLMVFAEKNSFLYSGNYAVQYPGTMTVSAVVYQEEDGYPGDLSLARLNINIIQQNSDGSTTLLESFLTNCDSNGIVTFERNYEKGVYTIQISLLEDGYYIPSRLINTVPIYQDGKGAVSCGGWLSLPNPTNGEPVKVTCNFNVKYKSGVADGSFKLFFEEAAININDSNIAWLVVDDNAAQFEGFNGSYTYRISCIDDKKSDYITIRIWTGNDTSATPILEIINQEQVGGNINVKDR